MTFQVSKRTTQNPHPPHSSLHPQFPKRAFTLLLPDHSGIFSMYALGTGISSSFPGKQWQCHDCFVCFAFSAAPQLIVLLSPQPRLCLGAPRACPVPAAEGGSLCASLRAQLGHCHGLSKGGKGAAELWWLLAVPVHHTHPCTE